MTIIITLIVCGLIAAVGIYCQRMSQAKARVARWAEPAKKAPTGPMPHVNILLDTELRYVLNARDRRVIQLPDGRVFVDQAVGQLLCEAGANRDDSNGPDTKALYWEFTWFVVSGGGNNTYACEFTLRRDGDNTKYAVLTIRPVGNRYQIEATAVEPDPRFRQYESRTYARAELDDGRILNGLVTELQSAVREQRAPSCG